MAHTVSPILNSMVIIIFVASNMLICAQGGIYYCIYPSMTSLCPKECLRCYNLTEFASEPSDVFVPNTTVILQSGNHRLQKSLSITNIEVLTLLSNTTSYGGTEITITCSDSGLFAFQNISQVIIRGIRLLGCVGNKVNSVNSFVLQNCSLHGQLQIGRGPAFDLYTVFLTEFIRCSFLFHAEGVLETRSYLWPDISKTVLLNECTFRNNIGVSRSILSFSYQTMLTIDDCLFTNNAASQDGIHISDYSSITILSSTFMNNSVDGYGAALGGGCTQGVVVIDNCTFAQNKAIRGVGGAVYLVDLYRSNVTINNTVFRDNLAAVSGALRTENGKITMYNTLFINNTAMYGDCGAFCTHYPNDSALKNCSFIKNHAGNTGGAINIVYRLAGLPVVQHNDMVIDTCVFVDNTANHSGGALSVSESTIGREHVAARLYMTDVNFSVNSAPYGGAIFIGSGLDLIINGSLNITNNTAGSSTIYISGSSICLFGNWMVSNNIGFLYAFSSNVKLSGKFTVIKNYFVSKYDSNQVGGAVTAFQSIIAFTGTTVMMYNIAMNGGAILATESKLHFYGETTLAYNTALSSGGGLYIHQSEVLFRNQTNISENEARDKGGGIHAVASSTKLTEGSLYINNNYANKGGGMSLELNSKLYIIKETIEQVIRLEFANNSAFVHGGALYIADDICMIETSECFFQSLYTYTCTPNSYRWPPNLLNTFFSNNSAGVAGVTLYGGLIDRCRVSPLSEFFCKYFDINSTTFTTAESYIFNVTNIQVHDLKTLVSSSPVRVCFCRYGEPDCSHTPAPIKVKKGQTFRITVVAVNQVNNTVPATIRASLFSASGGYFGRQSSYYVSDCSELKYSTYSPHNNETLVVYADGPCKDKGVSGTLIHLQYTACPIGFVDEQMGCRCDPNLYPDYVLSCYIDTETLIRKGNAWFMFVNTSAHEGLLAHRHCPFDYCHSSTQNVSVNLNVQNGADAICASNRSGKLCGSCGPELSLLMGSSHCKQCSNNWVALLLVFPIVGVVLVVFLLMCNLTVAVGTMNGLIFYANIVAANRAILFPFTKPNVLTVFISWLNLDLGFEVCFYDGMDGYVKTWLQFVFPLFIISLVIGIIVTAERYLRFAELLRGKNPVATLATLILLSYAKLSQTIIAALSLTSLEYSDGYKEVVWLTDANVSYLQGKHIPLFITAILVIIAGVAYTSLLFFWQWLRKWSKSARLNDFMDAYHAPYSEHHRYWIGLLLIVRLLLYIVSAVNVLGDPHINLLCINSAVVGLLLYQVIAVGYKGNVYKKWPLNILESIHFLNLIAFVSVTFYVTKEEGNQAIVAYLSTSAAFVTFVAILIYHACSFTILKKLWKKLSNSGCSRPSQRNLATNEIIQDKNSTTYNHQPTVSEIDCTNLPLVSSLSLPANTESDDSSLITQEASLISSQPYTITHSSQQISYGSFQQTEDTNS